MSLEPDPTPKTDPLPTVTQPVTELAVNLDDQTGEALGHATQTLLEDGALDVWTTPIAMKKQRPGVMLCLLCPTDQRERFAKRIIELTGSFGVRFREWDRLVLDRHHQAVETSFGSVRIKVGQHQGQFITAKPEFDDAQTLANQAGVPVQRVLDAARLAWSKHPRAEAKGGEHA